MKRVKGGGLLDPNFHFNEWERELAKLDIGWAKAALAFRGKVRFGTGSSIRAQSLPKVAEHFEQLRTGFEDGETYLILRAIEDAIIEGVPLPVWVGAGYRKLLKKHQSDGKTLDEIFCAPPSKGKRGRTQAPSLSVHRFVSGYDQT